MYNSRTYLPGLILPPFYNNTFQYLYSNTRAKKIANLQFWFQYMHLRNVIAFSKIIFHFTIPSTFTPEFRIYASYWEAPNVDSPSGYEQWLKITISSFTFSNKTPL
jgi:hypothetical protein